MVPEATVRWMQFRGKRLSEPFFRQSVAVLRESECPAWEIETGINSVIREGKRTPAPSPAGFIFHMSRCGSTLISNALKVLEGIQVVAEAHPINRVFMPCRPPNNSSPDARQDEDRGKLAGGLFNLFSCYRTGVPEPTVIKFASQNSLCLPTIRALWPDVPCLFVIRDPVEVLVSNLKNGIPNRFTESPALAFALGEVDSAPPMIESSFEDICARILGRYLEAAIRETGSNVRIIDYDDINQASIWEITKFFHIDAPLNRVRLNEVFQQYSKDPTGNRPFHSDRHEKLQGASTQMINAANRWVRPHYTYLRSQSRWTRLISQISEL